MKWFGWIIEEWWIIFIKKGGFIFKLFVFGLGKCWFCVLVRVYKIEVDSMKVDVILRESLVECEVFVYGIYNV